MTSVPTKLCYDHIKFLNFVLTWYHGKKKIAIYSPFTAKPSPEWTKAVQEAIGYDVFEEFNKTTLRLHIFHLLVDTAGKNPGTQLSCALILAPHVTVSGSFNCKHPHMETIAKTGAPNKKHRIIMDAKENINITEGRQTQSSKKFN
ncbi:hypothetical protein B0H16DRAFT_1743761 [Mycena metata]|uniref:Uncharacterized protein n=1 Tax=Mycena metata TaxID=1033252 RepID=A0AAD7H682_9AGAR|nr:hypothetical protein B0H16DRAFT_1743761 [Mycena metata]